MNESFASDLSYKVDMVYLIWFFCILGIGLIVLSLSKRYQIFSFISEKLSIRKRLFYLFKFFILLVVLYYFLWNSVVANIVNNDYLKLIITGFFIIIMFKPFQNLLSGILVFFNKNYPYGLPISYEKYVGKINDIKLFSIVIKLDDGNNLYIPSHDFITHIILDKSIHANENKIEFTLSISEDNKNALAFAKEAAITSNYLDYKAKNDFLLVESQNNSEKTIIKFIVYALNSSYRERLKSNIIEKINQKTESHG